MPRRPSAAVRPASLALTVVVVLQLLIPSTAATSAASMPLDSGNSARLPGIAELGYDPAWVAEAEAAPIAAADPSSPAGGANGINLVDDPGAADVVENGELVTARTETSRTVVNPDGTLTLEQSQERIHFLDPSGEWEPIDLSLVSDPEAGSQRRSPMTSRLAAMARR